MTDIYGAAKLALEALEHLQPTALTSFYTIGDRNKAITALREALAQPQEPVAWRWLYNGQPDSKKHFSMPGPDAEVISRASACEFPRTVQYLYTSPPAQRKPLTLDEVWLDDEMMKLIAVMMLPMNYFMKVIRAIEAAHGIKENT